MATVTGITAAKALEIQNASVVSGRVVGNDLYLTRGDTTEFNAGRIIRPPVDSWPVNSIYMSLSSANPSIALQGGTWARWGQGRVPVGVLEGDANHATVDGVGGSKTHSLQPNEGPIHNHTQTAHDHGGTQSGSVVEAYGSVPTAFYENTDWNVRQEAGGGYHNRVMVWTNSGNTTTHTHPIASVAPAIQNSGLGNPHNILQPYINVYMWKRTA